MEMEMEILILGWFESWMDGWRDGGMIRYDR